MDSVFKQLGILFIFTFLHLIYIYTYIIFEHLFNFLKRNTSIILRNLIEGASNSFADKWALNILFYKIKPTLAMEMGSPICNLSFCCLPTAWVVSGLQLMKGYTDIEQILEEHLSLSLSPHSILPYPNQQYTAHCLFFLHYTAIGRQYLVALCLVTSSDYTTDSSHELLVRQ